MREYLAGAGIEYHVHVIHQLGQKPFNRAKLLNVGFRETESFDYHAYHDVDLLPLDSDYSYVDFPTHLAAEVEQFGWKLPYGNLFGGVTLFSREDFLKVNGFSNDYWGWGCEDDDLFSRCKVMNLIPHRKKCRYASLAHARSPLQNYRANLKLLRDFRSDLTLDRVMADGLSSLAYSRLSIERLEADVTMLNVDI